MTETDKKEVPSLFENLTSSISPKYESTEQLKSWLKEHNSLFGNFIGNSHVLPQGKRFSVLSTLDNMKFFDLIEVYLFEKNNFF
jgi:hypothetical protein